MKTLLNINTWEVSSRMLPVNLLSLSTKIKRPESYILHNGGHEDFCLDLSPTEGNDYFSEAWSSNTNNFITVSEENIKIYNWKEKKPETIKKQIVSENLERFCEYLAIKSVNSVDKTKEIVPYVLKIYGQLRNLINDKKSGEESLNLLFLLLAAYEEKNVSDINIDKWGIKANEKINSIEFEKYYEDFSKGIRIQNTILPNVQLILRHASGRLFQEAHNEAEFFDKCPDLFTGLLSDEYLTQKVQYSSVHYTPTYIARAIVENALKQIDFNKDKLKILDPACGTSEFLMEVLKQLKTKKYKGEIEVIALDTSNIAINTSKFLLTYEKREWKNKLKFKTEKVTDSLTEKWDKDFDLILMNPPFCSWEQMNKKEREAVRETLGNTFKGKANQASAFLYKAVNAIKEDGIIGSVIPSSILTYNSYINVRNEINEILTPVLIAQLGNYVFKDALTNVSLFIGKKPRKNEMPLIIWTQNEKNIAPKAIKSLRKLQYENLPSINEENHSVYFPKVFPINKNNWKLLSYSEEELFTKIENLVSNGKLKRIKDIFSVKQGVRTGNNKVFKISCQQYNSLPEKERHFFKHCIDNNSINNNFLTIVNYVWFPYDKNGLIIANEEELKEKVSYYYNLYLLPNKNDLINKSRRKSTNWWKLSEHRAWLTTEYPKLVSTEFGKSDSFAYDKTGDFIVERGCGWILKNKNANVDFNYFYLAILSCPFFNKLLSIYSREILSGWDLGKESTKNIPVPYLSEKNKKVEEYQELIKLGKDISSGKLYNFEIIEKVLLPFYQLSR